MGTQINLTVGSTAGATQAITDATGLADSASVNHIASQQYTRSFSDTATAATSTDTASQVSTASVMLMGCSTSPNDHGGTENWDGWRTYNQSSLNTYSNRTGVNRPIFMAYSKSGPNLGGTTPDYNTVFNEVLTDLNNYYYTSQTGQTHSARWGIKLYWSNGNEMYDKGALTLPHTQEKIDNFTISQRALYDAVHYIDPTTGQRRFPDAFAGSNPVTYAEVQGYVADWLMPTAQYHDFVMWSMYPSGRDETVSDPTYDWPSFNDADWDIRRGWLLRCFRRTKLAEAEAGHPLLISCGEVGIGDDPDDNTTRPYFVVHSLYRGMRILAAQYSLTMPFACWWDDELSGGPQNILSDEDPATSPSTREAWQGAAGYDHTNGGTHPGSWAGNPKASWKYPNNNGTVV